MSKLTPDPPNPSYTSEPEIPTSETLEQTTHHDCDERHPCLAKIRATPRTPSTMFTVNPNIDVQTLLGCVSESLASASVITMDVADRETGTSRNSLLGVHQILMVAELSVNRALDQLDPIA
jgi:hypothetical protein